MKARFCDNELSAEVKAASARAADRMVEMCHNMSRTIGSGVKECAPAIADGVSNELDRAASNISVVCLDDEEC